MSYASAIMLVYFVFYIIVYTWWRGFYPLTLGCVIYRFEIITVICIVIKLFQFSRDYFILTFFLIYNENTNVFNW